jgi:O-antigen/teichoic acid export membrane protein
MNFINKSVRVLHAHSSIKNLFWNIINGSWLGLLILLVTPIYVSSVGLAGYGLISFWLMIQILIGLLDFGIGSTLVREFASSFKNRLGKNYRQDLLKTLEFFFWTISILFAAIFILMSGWISNTWLKLNIYEASEFSRVLIVMAVSISFQFPFSLYINGLAGLQEHRRMNLFQIICNTIRYAAGSATLLWKPDLYLFFLVQSIISVAQTYFIRQDLWRIISNQDAYTPIFKISILNKLWRFSLGMSLNSIVAIMLANADRIALSKMLPLSQLGEYGLAFTATGLIQLGIQPFYRVFFPKYSELFSLGKLKELRHEYFESCKLMACVIIPLGFWGWVFAPLLFKAWLGYSPENSVQVFRFLSIAITCAGIGWLPAAFQQSQGWSKLHVQMMILALIIGTPLMVFMIKSYGLIGATSVWLLHGFIDLTLGLWLMHKRILIGELLTWYRLVIIPPLLISLLISILFWQMISIQFERYVGLFFAIIILIFMLFMTLSYHFIYSRKIADF